MIILIVVLGFFSTLGLLQVCLMFFDNGEIFEGIIFGAGTIALGIILSHIYLDETKESQEQTQGIKECQPQQ